MWDTSQRRYVRGVDVMERDRSRTSVPDGLAPYGTTLKGTITRRPAAANSIK